MCVFSVFSVTAWNWFKFTQVLAPGAPQAPVDCSVHYSSSIILWAAPGCQALSRTLGEQRWVVAPTHESAGPSGV